MTNPKKGDIVNGRKLTGNKKSVYRKDRENSRCFYYEAQCLSCGKSVFKTISSFRKYKCCCFYELNLSLGQIINGRRLIKINDKAGPNKKYTFECVDCKSIVNRGEIATLKKHPCRCISILNKDHTGEEFNNRKLIRKTTKDSFNVQRYLSECLLCGKHQEMTYACFKKGFCRCDKYGVMLEGIIPKWYYNSIKRGAKIRNIDFKLTPKELANLFIDQKKRCALSGEEIHFNKLQKNRATASLDRIDSKGIYEIQNVQWVHKDVNNMKMNISTKRFIQLCKSIVEHFGKVVV